MKKKKMQLHLFLIAIGLFVGKYVNMKIEEPLQFQNKQCLKIPMRNITLTSSLEWHEKYKNRYLFIQHSCPSYNDVEIYYQNEIISKSYQVNDHHFMYDCNGDYTRISFQDSKILSSEYLLDIQTSDSLIKINNGNNTVAEAFREYNQWTLLFYDFDFDFRILGTLIGHQMFYERDMCNEFYYNTNIIILSSFCVLLLLFAIIT